MEKYYLLIAILSLLVAFFSLVYLICTRTKTNMRIAREKALQDYESLILEWYVAYLQDEGSHVLGHFNSFPSMESARNYVQANCEPTYYELRNTKKTFYAQDVDDFYKKLIYVLIEKKMIFIK